MSIKLQPRKRAATSAPATPSTPEGLFGTGVLHPQQREDFAAVLRGGVTYHVYMSPQEPGVDFDVHVFDERGNLVAFDADTSSDAYCVLRPAWTGPFYIVVSSSRGSSAFTVGVVPE